MIERLISFQRPRSMSDAEMRAWIAERTRAGRSTLTIGEAGGRDPDGLVLRVDLRADSVEAADEQLADLMLDMRLLGLRPSLTTVAS